MAQVRLAVAVGEPDHDRVFPLGGAVGEEEAGEHRREQHGEDQRAEQGEGDRPGHRLEEAAFDRLQGEDGQVGGDDDGRWRRRPGAALRARPRESAPSRSCRRCGVAEMADDVLDHDDRAVDDHAEVQRAEREQVGGDVARSRQMEAKSSANGMVMATMMAPRTLPRKRNRMMTTRMMPSVRLCSTVCVV
jgi:hypothetical protein